MRPRIQKWIGTLGALCLAFTPFLHWKGVCIYFFGEYPFPEEE